jgi:signal recognition particle subunit SRP54
MSFSRSIPREMLIKICHDELVELLGADNTGHFELRKARPTTIMLVGLQGSGKTTSAGKLAYLHKNKLNKKVLLGGLDVYRPAAIEQLGTLAKQIGVDFFEMGTDVIPGRSRQESQRSGQWRKATTF